MCWQSLAGLVCSKHFSASEAGHCSDPEPIWAAVAQHLRSFAKTWRRADDTGVERTVGAVQQSRINEARDTDLRCERTATATGSESRPMRRPMVLVLAISRGASLLSTTTSFTAFGPLTNLDEAWDDTWIEVLQGDSKMSSGSGDAKLFARVSVHYGIPPSSTKYIRSSPATGAVYFPFGMTSTDQVSGFGRFALSSASSPLRKGRKHMSS